VSDVYSDEQLAEIVAELAALPQETAWAEFKENYTDEEGLGRYLSALSNSAALDGKPRGFMVWGIRDADHEYLGTTFDPFSAKKGNEDLIPWLTRGLTPRVHFEFDVFEVEGRRLVMMSVAAASHRPVQFDGQEFIRVGSYVKNLKDYSDHERRLWQFFSKSAFEAGIALDRVSEEAVLRSLDYATYFDLTGQPIPGSTAEIMETLEAEALIASSTGGKWSITNLGAVLFALDLGKFPGLRRKAVRVISYDGRDRAAPAQEQVGARGYASGFRGMLTFIAARLPSKEVFEEGVRRVAQLYPDKAIRELVVNALVHQDFTISGSGPVVEIFSDRIEITNPGKSLVDVRRIIDAAPKSRNEDLASLARRMGLCEERGSGWDQVATLVEANELPAPLVETEDEFMRVTVFEHRPLSMYSREEKVRAVYFHACLRHVGHERTTNTSVRTRFRISPNNVAKASRLIKEALAAGVVVPYDPAVGAKAMSYVPFWADPTR
jgi:ATP-dependent DNA helicase RecG